MKLKKVIFSSYLTCLGFWANAQFYEQANQSIIHANKNPTAPTTSSLGTFSDFNVDYFSGRVTTQIPLASLNVDGFTLPIDLSYLPTGIKVMSSSSWVGTGWALQVGGVITRNVNGIADDKWGINERGYAFSNLSTAVGMWSNVSTNPNSPKVSKTHYEAFNEITEADNLFNAFRLQDLKDNGSLAGNGPRYDTEPDNFSYSFLGRSGKFFITPNKQALLVPYNDLKFELIFEDISISNITNSRLEKIIITDEQGVKYHFGARELTNISAYSAEYNLNTPYRDPSFHGGANYFSAWYLNKIVLQNQEEIVFTYQIEENQLLPYPFRSQSIRNSPDAEGNASANSTNHQENKPQYSIVSSGIRTNVQRLATIESRLWKVVFNAIHVREDVEGSNALTSVEVFSKEVGNTKLIKNWQFNYRYHNCKTSSQVVDYTSPGISYTANKFKRLFLDNIVETAQNESNQKYNFSYYENEPMPSPSSAEQDFWGYYNANNSKTLMPAIDIYSNEALGYKKYSVYHRPYSTSPSATFSLPGANRKPNWFYSQLGSLKTIEYPTKGTLTFEYESNDYEFEGSIYLGPGIRVLKTTQFDGISISNNIVKEYRYTKPNGSSSGVLFNFPAFAYLENTHDYLAPGVLVGNGPAYFPYSSSTGFPFSYPINDVRRYQYFLSRLDNPQFVSSGINGDALGYKYVTEIVNNKFKTEYHFSCPSPFGVTSDPINAEDYEFGGAGDDLFDAPINFACRSTGAYGWGTMTSAGGYLYSSYFHRPFDISNMDVYQPFAYPFAPTYNYDWNRGLLLEKKEFDENNVLQKQTTRKYKLFTPNNSGPQYIKGLKVGYSENYGCAPINPSNGLPTNALRNIYIASKYKVMGGLVKLPESEQVTMYSSTQNTQISTKYNFTYKANSPQMQEISFLDSKNTLNQIIYKYPSDFALNGNVYQEMVNRNMVSPILEKINIVNNIQSQKEKVEYDYFINNQILPSILSKSFGGSSLKTMFTNNLYDNKGNILEIQKVNEIPECFIWGYGSQYPVAKIVGTTWAAANTVFTTADLTVINNPATTDVEMSLVLNKLRSIANTFVTTYTYKPLVGVTSETDANGKTTTYEYDNFNRLKLIRDFNGNILKTFDYKYKQAY